jgi:hypothetical protein
MFLTAPVTDPPKDPVPPRPTPPDRMPAGRAILIMFFTLLFAALLSADDLVRVAGEQPFGTRRDVALAIANPIDRLSDFLSLDRPRAWLTRVTGHDELTDVGTVALPPPSTVPPSTRPSPATTSTTVPAPTTTLPSRRVPTPEQPLRVLVAGDSLVGTLADEFARFVHTDPRITVSSDWHVATGLARPDVLNWPVQLTNLVNERQPDVVVLMFGGNDDQDMITADGSRVIPGTDPWRAEYERRVAQMMDIAAAGGRTVVWVGMPIVTKPHLEQTKDIVNAVVAVEASARPDVHVIDTATLLAPPGGGFTDYLPDANGNPVRVRERDGVHITHAGCDHLTPALLMSFAYEWHVDTPWAPPATTTTTAPAAPPAQPAP